MKFCGVFFGAPAKFPQEIRWGKYYSSAKYLMVRTIWEV